MRILSIGNSFSQDATKYLVALAKEAGVEVETVNLYIGGCTLYTHVKNLRAAAKAYSYELNGDPTAESVSINEIVEEGGFDVITLQQASHYSGIEATYHPYLEELASYLREKAPEAKLYIHETWSYDPASTHDGFPMYSCDSGLMYERVSACYRAAAKAIDAGFLPVGDGVELLRKTALFAPGTGKYAVNRDGFHLSIPYGRVFASLVWAEKLCGIDARKSTFVPQSRFGLADAEAMVLLREKAHEVCAEEA